MQELFDIIYTQLDALYDAIDDYIYKYGELPITKEENEKIKDYAIHRLVNIMNDDEESE